MRLTKRGRGLVAGLIISTVGILGWQFNEGDGNYTLENGEPTPVVQHIEEDEPGWNCTTMGNKSCNPVPLDDMVQENWDMDTESDMPATNPCPWELQDELDCEF